MFVFSAFEKLISLTQSSDLIFRQMLDGTVIGDLVAVAQAIDPMIALQSTFERRQSVISKHITLGHHIC